MAELPPFGIRPKRKTRWDRFAIIAATALAWAVIIFYVVPWWKGTFL